MRRFLLLASLLTTLLLVSCGDSDVQNSSEEGASMEAGTPGFGVYNLLKASGNHVEVGKEVKQPFFKPTGRILTMNGQELQVFEFPDSQSAAAAAASVSADGSHIGGSATSWPASPHFFKTDRVIVLYVGDDPATISALGTALGGSFAGK
jgi:hypothetical protein